MRSNSDAGSPGNNEAACRDQYLELLNFLRANYSVDFEITSVCPDLIDFLIGLEFLRAKVHLHHLFKLCCLYKTSRSPKHPAVTLGAIDTSGLQGRITDVHLPGQMYLSGVSNLVSFCTQDSNLSNFFLACR